MVQKKKMFLCFALRLNIGAHQRNFREAQIREKATPASSSVSTIGFLANRPSILSFGHSKLTL
jgi:hypothetical protein